MTLPELVKNHDESVNAAMTSLRSDIEAIASKHSLVVTEVGCNRVEGYVVHVVLVPARVEK